MYFPSDPAIITPKPFIQWCQDVIATPDKWLILDTETTGLDENAQIVELSILDMFGNSVYDSLLKPKCFIPFDAQKIHHITEDMVKGVPTIVDVWPHVCDVVGNRKVIVYNANYDKRLIEQSLNAYGSNLFPDWQYYCAMFGYALFYDAPAREGKRTAPWQKLEYACQQQGAQITGPLHRAMSDCRATLSLIRKVAESGDKSITYGTPRGDK